MVSESDQWIEKFLINATRDELHTLLEFTITNGYDESLINQLRYKIDKAS